MIDFIIKHEGYRSHAYLCPAKVWTIGYGHTRTAKPGMVIDKEEALRLLEEDLVGPRAAATAVTGLTSGPIYTAVVSFIFNCGVGALHGKTTQIGRHLLNKDYEKAVSGMRRYIFGNGRKLLGLVKRRKEEGDMILESIKTRHTNR